MLPNDAEDRPKLIHDTRRIVSVNAALTDLFQCDETALVDLDLLELLINDSYRWLARQRLMHKRYTDLPPFVYAFRRCDGSAFWGVVLNMPLPGDRFETTVIYVSEKREV